MVYNRKSSCRVGGVADQLEVPLLHGPGAQRADGPADLALGMAPAARVRAHPAADGAYTHTGGRHTASSAGQGGRSAGSARIPRLAAGRRPHHRFCSH